MKTLLTTDFTDSSKNAIDYAIQLLSKEDQVKYKLVHAHKPMVSYSGEKSIPVLENPALKDKLKKELEEMQWNLKDEYTIDVEPELKRGGVYEVVHRLEKNDSSHDLVVMATREKSFFERMTFGSNTLQVAQNAETPVLIVPREAKSKSPKTIAFATDLEPLHIPYTSLKLVKDLIDQHDAALEVVHVYESEEEKEKSVSMKDTAMHRYMEEIEHKHVSMINESVYDGIIDYISKHKPDMLVLIPRDRNFFEQLFDKSVSKQMARDTDIPSLVLN
ncbi:universal stress protein [Reichenbachiella ulvae]|uniref:Universal stress protein n=1 Tax=Reichenbachiella ulvae TaxID=2980104 RepID=A0ABT3CUS8_9BACT|nr:universal stress protein [Reichenbachiella ulvae]MCV9387319.1 universal stress protein [Reichenbachiella ulvae]